MKTLKYQGKYEWKYNSINEMKTMYPNYQYRVLGEIYNKVGKNQTMPLYDAYGNVFYVQPIGTYKKPFYKTAGYMWCEEANGFVLVKKSNLSNLFGYGIMATLILTFVFFGIRYFMNSSNIDPNAKDFESNIQRTADMDDTRILVPGYNDWNMKAGTNEVYVALYNPDKNPCYFQFSIVLDDTNEVLFETGLVPPGQAVTTVKLPRNFEKGTYPITVNIKSFSLNDESQKLNGGEVKTNIVALEE